MKKIAGAIISIGLSLSFLGCSWEMPENISVKTNAKYEFSLGNYKKGDDIEIYLDNLYKSPDRVGYFIDDDGNVTQKDEFEL